MKIVKILPLFLFASCAQHYSPYPQPQVVHAPGEGKIYSEDDKETVILLGTNDLHGALDPGAYLAAHGHRLSRLFPQHVFGIDGGNRIQGSASSALAPAEPSAEILQRTGVQAVVPGNEELAALLEKPSTPLLPTVATNVRGVEGLETSRLFPLGRYQIGVVGYVDRSTVAPHLGKSLQKLTFLDSVESIQNEAQNLRNSGAHLVILAAHGGMTCFPHPNDDPAKNRLRNAESVQPFCDPSSPLTRLLRKLPENLIDAVVLGHGHQPIHQWIAGIPVIQSAGFAQSYHLVYFTLNPRTGQRLPKLTWIEGPIPTGPTVLGQTVYPDWKSRRETTVARQLTEEERSRLLTRSPLPIEPREVSEILRKATETDFAILNDGAVKEIRTHRPLTYGDLYEAIPHDAKVTVMELTGRELKRILQVANNGARPQTINAGLVLHLRDPESPGKAKDLDGNGRISHWEVDRLISVRTDHGRRIHDSKHYRVATIDYLAHGGDDLSWAVGPIPASRIKDSPQRLRDLVAQYLEENDPSFQASPNP